MECVLKTKLVPKASQRESEKRADAQQGRMLTFCRGPSVREAGAGKLSGFKLEHDT